MSYLLYLPLLLGAACASDPFWYPGGEEGAQVASPSAAELLSAVQGGRTLVAHFAAPRSEQEAKDHMDNVNSIMLRVVAQALHRRNVSVVCVSMNDVKDVAEQQGIVEDSILIYKQGEHYVYAGHRSAEPLIAFVNKLDAPIVNIIQNKQEKKTFDHISSTKVIGYFQTWPTSPEMMAFEAAAKVHYPRVPFYAVVTEQTALNMRFTSLGEVHVIHPFEKTPQIPQQNPATEADITDFLQVHARPSMQQVTMEDLHGVWDSAGEARIVAFICHRCPGCNALYKAFKTMSKFGLLRNTTDKTIYIINPTDFPALTDHWQTTLGVDLSSPALGLLNVTDNTVSWADLTDFTNMNTTDQVAYLSLWLEAVSAGRVRVDGVQTRPSAADLNAVARDASAMAQRAAEAAQAAAAAAQAAADAAQAASQSSSPHQDSPSTPETKATPPEGSTMQRAEVKDEL